MTDFLSDQSIIERTQRGEADTFGFLVERYEDKITRYAKRFLSQTEDIKDLVQDVFVKAYINIQSFDSSRPFSPWLYRIAHNEFINELKKRKNRPFINIDFNTDILFPHPEADETADKETDLRLVREALETCLAEVDDKYREPLVLSYFQELEYKEIAEVLHIPISTVGVRLARGKEILKKLYAEKYGKQ